MMLTQALVLLAIVCAGLVIWQLYVLYNRLQAARELSDTFLRRSKVASPMGMLDAPTDDALREAREMFGTDDTETCGVEERTNGGQPRAPFVCRCGLQKGHTGPHTCGECFHHWEG